MRLLSSSLILLAGMIVLSTPHSGWAQIRLQSGSSLAAVSPTPTSVANRDIQLDQLAEEVSALERQVKLLRRVVKLVAPTVVHIEAIKDAHSDKGLASSKQESKRVEEAGAGVIVNIDSNNYVITNRHVVHPARLESIRIELTDRTVMHPRRIWTDASTDIAIMAIDSPGVIPARIGDSDGIDIGDFVLAVGSPFGLSHSVSYGIISAKGRRNLELGAKSIEIQDFFQTDAAINPGNSGGPLMNLRGEVIGINTAIASSSGGNEGIGFSIPMNMVMTVARQLVDRGELKRAYLGVQMDNAFDVDKSRRLGLAQPVGALVKAVKRQSPAELAGIRVGDVILRFDGATIENDGHLVQTVGLTPVDKEVEAVIMRDGSRFVVKIKLTALES